MVRRIGNCPVLFNLLDLSGEYLPFLLPSLLLQQYNLSVDPKIKLFPIDLNVPICFILILLPLQALELLLSFSL
jgi:hypothetical protein